MRKSSIFGSLALAVLALAGCSQEIGNDAPSAAGKEYVITASLEGGNSKTYIDKTGHGINWKQYDAISVFYKGGTGYEFINQAKDGPTGEFHGTLPVVVGDGEDVPGDETKGDAPLFWAIYPYDRTANSVEGLTATVPFILEQAVVEGTFDSEAFVSLGNSTGLDIKFYNVYGLLKIQVSKTGADKIVLTPNSENIKFYSSYNVEFQNGVPVITGVAGEGSSSISIECKGGFVPQEDYYMAVPPTVFEGGLAFSLYAGETLLNTVDTKNTLSVVRSKVHAVPVLEVPEPEIPEPVYEGDWIIVGEGKGVYYAATKYADGVYIPVETVTIENDAVSGHNATMKFTFTQVASGAYTIQDPNRLYLYAASTKDNQLKAAASATVPTDPEYLWSISANEDGTVSIVAEGFDGINDMRFNSGSPRVSCYSSKSTLPHVKLYPWTAPAEKCAVPTFSPAAGEVESGTVVTISCATEGASIFWAYAGADGAPVAGTEFTPYSENGILITKAATIVAYATKEEMVNSAYATATYTIKSEVLPTEEANGSLVFSKAKLTNGEEIKTLYFGDVTLVADNGTNTTTPKYYDTGAAARFYGGNTFTLSSPGKVIKKVTLTFSTGEGTNAIKADSGTYENGEWSGNATSVTFTIDGTSGHRRIASITVGTPTPTVATPVFNPAGGEVESNTIVYISCATEGASIFWAYAGADGAPVAGTEFTPYSENGILITEAATIVAYATKEEMVNSAYATATYTIKEPEETVATPVFNPAAGEVESGTVVTISCATQGATIKWAYASADGSPVDESAYTEYTEAGITINEAATIIAYATKEGLNDSEYATASYRIKPEITTIAGIIAAIPETAVDKNTAVSFDANLPSPAVVSYVNGISAYIQDNTGAILLFLSDHGLNAGNTIKGKLSVKAYWFNGIPEMVEIGSEYEKGSGTAPEPVVVTIADLLANFNDYLLRLIKLEGVKVTDAIADSDRNGEVAQGASSIAVYAQQKSGLSLTEGAEGDLVAIPGLFNTTKQVYFWQNDWFTASYTPPTIEAENITNVPAAGVTDATTTVTFNNAEGWAARALCDGRVVTSASIDGTTITYTVAANEATTARQGSITVILIKDNEQVSKTIVVSQAAPSSGNVPSTGDVLYSCDFGTVNNVALASYTGGTSYNSASSISYSTNDATNCYISTDSANNMTSGNIFLRNKSYGKAGLSATISGIKTYGATKVTVFWACNNTNSQLEVSESSDSAMKSANSATNRAVFTLSGTETTISLVLSGTSSTNSRVDDVRVVFGEVTE